MLRPAKQLRKATNFGINIFLTLAAVTKIPEGVVIGFLTHVDEGPRKGSREGPSSALSKNCLLIILITAIVLASICSDVQAQLVLSTVQIMS